jgi:hypothetical protein
VWTILIATQGRRAAQLQRLLAGLLPQAEAAGGQVKVLALWNNGERRLGEVRQDLLWHATGTYVSFVDDDDEVPPYYVSAVLPLLDGTVDYIGWRMQCYIDGVAAKPTIHSLRYSGWHDDEDGYYRDITHLNPVRRQLALLGDFRTAWPEDSTWVASLRGHVRTEAFIDRPMYLYRYSSSDSVQDTGPVEVVMATQMSGFRGDRRWPALGASLTVSEDEARHLVRAGIATRPPSPPPPPRPDITHPCFSWHPWLP